MGEVKWGSLEGVVGGYFEKLVLLGGVVLCLV